MKEDEADTISKQLEKIKNTRLLVNNVYDLSEQTKITMTITSFYPKEMEVIISDKEAIVEFLNKFGKAKNEQLNKMISELENIKVL